MKEKFNELWGKLSLKTKLIIIGVSISLLFTMIFVVILFVPLLVLGIGGLALGDGLSSGGTSSGGTSISESADYFWPVGSMETTIEDGKKFATGNPVSTYITSPYGNRIHPGTGKESFHSGVDIGSGGNGYGVVPIIAANSGTVTLVVSSDSCVSTNIIEPCPDNGGYGNHIKISHSDGSETLYAHLHQNTIIVSEGEEVEQGQVVAMMGSSGTSNGAHLHFEVRVNGSPVDPLNYISADNSRPTSSFTQGSGNLNTVCLSLKNYGFSDVAIGGIMANIEGEGMFSPTCKEQGPPYEGLGIVQWSYSRKTELLTTYGASATTLDAQLEFLFYELENKYTSVLNSIKSETSAYEVTRIWCQDFEKPLSCDSRLNAKKYDIYEDYAANGCSGHTVGTSTFCAPDGQYIQN